MGAKGHSYSYAYASSRRQRRPVSQRARRQRDGSVGAADGLKAAMKALEGAQRAPGLGLPKGTDWLLQLPEVMQALHSDQKALSHVYMHYVQLVANATGQRAFIAGGKLSATARATGREQIRSTYVEIGDATRGLSPRDDVLSMTGGHDSPREQRGVPPMRWPALKLFCMDFGLVGRLATMEQVRRVAVSVVITDAVARAKAAGRSLRVKAMRAKLESGSGGGL